jgi:hypothetical protein
MKINDDCYDLDEMIHILEDIRNNEEGIINPAKVWYTLSKEIEKIKFWIESNPKPNFEEHS